MGMEDQARGLTVELCRERLQQLDERISASGPDTATAKLERWLECRAWFDKQLERLLRRQRSW
jgi:hypothetical protein